MNQLFYITIYFVNCFDIFICVLYLLPTPAYVYVISNWFDVKFSSFAFLFSLFVLFFSFLATQHINILLHFYCHPFSDSPFFAFFSVVFIYYAYSSHLIVHTQAGRESERKTLTHSQNIYLCAMCPCIEYIYLYMRRISLLPHIKINLAQNNMDFWFIQFCHFTSYNRIC